MNTAQRVARLLIVAFGTVMTLGVLYHAARSLGAFR